MNTSPRQGSSEGRHADVAAPPGEAVLAQTTPEEPLPRANAMPGNEVEGGPPDDVAELRQEIEQTRAQLGETVEQLAAKADIKAQAKARAIRLAGRFMRKIALALAHTRTRTGRVQGKPATNTGSVELAPTPTGRANCVDSRPSMATPQDIIAAIAAQHEHVKALLARVQQETGQRRTEALHKLRLTLALHETAEERAIHPQALHQLGPYDRAANDRIAEEQTAGQTIRALEMLNVDSDQFNFTFGHFASSVAEHADAEEKYEWPALLQIAEITTANAMVEQMLAVTKLVEDPAAPGIAATFEEMRQWAKSRLPEPPRTHGR